jgi:ribose 5-phosphate isomerase B
MRVGIAADHGGFQLKEQFVVRLNASHEVVDFGAHQLALDDDSPDFVIPLGQQWRMARSIAV